jgi:hypothetical protein
MRKHISAHEVLQKQLCGATDQRLTVFVSVAGKASTKEVHVIMGPSGAFPS